MTETATIVTDIDRSSGQTTSTVGATRQKAGQRPIRPDEDMQSWPNRQQKTRWRRREKRKKNLQQEQNARKEKEEEKAK